MMDMKMRYVVKGINKAQTIQSVVAIHTTEDGAKITKVQDKWNGELPEGSVQDVSSAFPAYFIIKYWKCKLTNMTRPSVG